MSNTEARNYKIVGCTLIAADVQQHGRRWCLNEKRPPIYGRSFCVNPCIWQWGRGESNPYALRHQILSLACLPIPALPRAARLYAAAAAASTIAAAWPRRNAGIPGKWTGNLPQTGALELPAGGAAFRGRINAFANHQVVEAVWDELFIQKGRARIGPAW